jgi:hypothetical protein
MRRQCWRGTWQVLNFADHADASYSFHGDHCRHYCFGGAPSRSSCDSRGPASIRRGRPFSMTIVICPNPTVDDVPQQPPNLLYQGHDEQLRCALEQLAVATAGNTAANLRAEAGYFPQNQHCMNYLGKHEDAWPISSGIVENVGKQFKARLVVPVMRRSLTGAESSLAGTVRPVIHFELFDEKCVSVWGQTRSLSLSKRRMACPSTSSGQVSPQE